MGVPSKRQRRGHEWRMTSVKPSNRRHHISHQRGHMLINGTAPSSSHRHLFSKETESHIYQQTRCWQGIFLSVSESWTNGPKAPYWTPGLCHVSVIPVTQGEQGRASPKRESGFRIQTESIPRHSWKSIMEDRLFLWGHISHSWQNCKGSPLHIAALFMSLLCFAHNADIHSPSHWVPQLSVAL